MTVRTLSCPSCGAAITLRALEWTQNVVCASCGSVLDARDPSLAIIQRFSKALRVDPAIPLGTRGQWRGAPYEVIGFQVRKIVVDDLPYFWREYLLFNPYHGFRYLTEYDGNWNDVIPLPVAPMSVRQDGKPTMKAVGRTFRHFQTATATTTFIIGEFPWEVRSGDEVEASDYTDPPFLLSAERTEDEVTWSLGEYTDSAEIWRAFKPSGVAPMQKGVYVNQPNPFAKYAGLWKPFGLFAAALVLMMLLRMMTADAREVHRGNYVLHRGDTTATIFVTPSFELPGDKTNVAVDLSTDAENTWVYLNYTLIEERTGAVYDFGREVSYFTGVDSDGRWTEGSRRDKARIAAIPEGRYFMRVEATGQDFGSPVTGTLRVRRDVPSLLPFLLALLALVLPPGFVAIRSQVFESQRWAESDYAPKGGDDDSEDE